MKTDDDSSANKILHALNQDAAITQGDHIADAHCEFHSDFPDSLLDSSQG